MINPLFFSKTYQQRKQIIYCAHVYTRRFHEEAFELQKTVQNIPLHQLHQQQTNNSPLFCTLADTQKNAT